MDIIEHHGVKGMRWGHRKLHNMVENHKENLRYKYRKKGLNEQQVEAKLQRRLKTEKTLLKTAAVVGTAAAAYALKNKVQDDFIGRTIKKVKHLIVLAALIKLINLDLSTVHSTNWIN